MKPAALACLLVFAAAPVPAQEEARTQQPKPQASEPKPVGQEPVKPPATGQQPDKPVQDPFAADEEVRKLLGDKKPDPLAFQPLSDRPALPDMHLRGIVRLHKKGKPAALVELTGLGSYTVREGESISFTVPGRLLTASAGSAGSAVPNRPPMPGAYATGEQRERAKEQGALPSETTVRTGVSQGVSVREQIPIVLRVERVAQDGVVVEIGTMGQYLVIR